MKLSTKGRYGLRAMLDIAQNEKDGPVTLNNIAARQDISKRYLEQILVALKQAGLVNSVRGFQGGFVLAREPEKIVIREIITTLEGPIAPVECVSGDKPCSCLRNADCVTQTIWRELRDAMTKVLDSYTLENLIKSDGRKT